MIYRPERVEQVDGQEQLPSHKYTGDPAQSAKSYNIFIPILSLSAELITP